jgi:hypothetical protein
MSGHNVIRHNGTCFEFQVIGGAEGDRTPDLMTASSSLAIFLNQNN